QIGHVAFGNPRGFSDSLAGKAPTSPKVADAVAQGGEQGVAGIGSGGARCSRGKGVGCFHVGSLARSLRTRAVCCLPPASASRRPTITCIILHGPSAAQILLTGTRMP